MIFFLYVINHHLIHQIYPSIQPPTLSIYSSTTVVAVNCQLKTIIHINSVHRQQLVVESSFSHFFLWLFSYELPMNKQPFSTNISACTFKNIVFFSLLPEGYYSHLKLSTGICSKLLFWGKSSENSKDLLMSSYRPWELVELFNKSKLMSSLYHVFVTQLQKN